MSHVFISYSHKDSDYAHKVAKALYDERFPVWIDDRIEYGSQWPREIQMQLDASSAVVVIMSPHSLNSEWVQKELHYALRVEKQIFPLLLNGEAWFSVETTNYVDVKDGRLPPDKFYGDISKYVVRRAVDAQVWDYAAQMQFSLDSLGDLTAEIISPLLKLVIKNFEAIRKAQNNPTDAKKLEQMAVNNFAQSLEIFTKATTGKVPHYRKTWVDLYNALLGVVDTVMVQKLENKIKLGDLRTQLVGIEADNKRVFGSIRRLRNQLVGFRGRLKIKQQGV